MVRQIALGFPGAVDDISHNGTPSIKVRGKLLCRLHEESSFIPIRVGFELRERLLESHPEHFHMPDHFKKYPYIALWCSCRDRELIRDTLHKAWKQLASKKQLDQFGK